jgi:hypothetical protein
MGFWRKLVKIITDFVSRAEYPDDHPDWIEVRNRDEKGRFKGDKQDTLDINEAFVKVKGSAKGKFKDNDPNKPGVQNEAVKKPVAKRPRKKST